MRHERWKLSGGVAYYLEEESDDIRCIHYDIRAVY